MAGRTGKVSSAQKGLKRPLITVIVPVYNVEKYLKKCLDSIVSQTYNNLQIILVNDGSTDNSAAVCARYLKKDSRIELIEQENAGLSAARNVGIERAKGEYLAFIDSDDVVDSDYIEYLYNLIVESGADMSICGIRESYDSGKERNLSRGYKNVIIERSDCLKRMLLEQGYNCSAYAKLYKRELWGDIAYPYAKHYEDLGTTYRYILRGHKVAFGSEAKYEYFIRKGSISHSKFSMKKLDIVELTDQMCGDIEATTKSEELRKICRLRRMHARLSVLRMVPVCTSNSKVIEAKREMSAYIKAHKNDIFENEFADKRDKLALWLACVSFVLYRATWAIYSTLR